MNNNWEEIFRKDKEEREKVISDAGMTFAKSLGDIEPGEKGLFVYTFQGMQPVDVVTHDLWIKSGKGFEQRSWCCHAGTALYKKV